jgi:hypothetical protein
MFDMQRAFNGLQWPSHKVAEMIDQYQMRLMALDKNYTEGICSKRFSEKFFVVPFFLHKVGLVGSSLGPPDREQSGYP